MPVSGLLSSHRQSRLDRRQQARDCKSIGNAFISMHSRRTSLDDRFSYWTHIVDRSSPVEHVSTANINDAGHRAHIYSRIH